MSYFWNVRGLLRSDAFPIHSVKERVRLYFLNSVDAEALVGLCDQSLYQVFAGVGEVDLGWDLEMVFPVEDLFARLLGLVRKEGRVPHDHFK